MKFFTVTAIKRFPLAGWTTVQEGQTLSVAKWNELFVLATPRGSFAILTAEQCQERVKTVRDSNGKPVPAQGTPAITGKEVQFTWRVEAGHTCPDGCCGEDAPRFEKTCGSKEEAIELAKKLENGDFKGALAFVRVMGPAFYQKHWNRPAM
jgi:hypothetical protein